VKIQSYNRIKEKNIMSEERRDTPDRTNDAQEKKKPRDKEVAQPSKDTDVTDAPATKRKEGTKEYTDAGLGVWDD
jgi:hypothetical protein